MSAVPSGKPIPTFLKLEFRIPPWLRQKGENEATGHRYQIARRWIFFENHEIGGLSAWHEMPVPKDP